MTLHNIMKPEPAARIRIRVDPDEEENEELSCEQCGAASFSRIIYGRYSQSQTVTIGERYANYDDLETEGWDEADSWECYNGHYATVDLAEALDEIS